MALTADEQKLLDELTAKASQQDADSDYEIEIFSGDKGARIPFSQGQAWLYKEFGIGEAPAPPADGGGDQGDGGGDQGAGKGKKTAIRAPGYFGKKP